jgi:branched-chain amino acid transport system permease protein
MVEVAARSTLLRHLAVAVVAGAVLVGLTEHFTDYGNTELATAALYFCAIAGLTLLTGRSGQISLGNGAFMCVGAYTVALLLLHHPLGNKVNGYNNKELVVVLLASVVVAAATGGLVGVAAARLRGPYLAGVTLALALGLPALPTYGHLESKLGGHAGFAVTAPLAPHGLDQIRWQAWICCICAAILYFLLANVSESRTGRAFEAVRDDEVAASLAGMSVARVQIRAFVVSAGSAGLAGGLYAIVSGAVTPGLFPLQLSLLLLAGAVFGGLGSLAGAAYGAVLLTFLSNWSTDIANALSLPTKVNNNLPIALYGLALIVAMLAFPLGLQGLVRQTWTLGARWLGGTGNEAAKKLTSN